MTTGRFDSSLIALPGWRDAGFTLVELVVTLTVIGILAAVAVPRFVQQSDFDAFGFASQTRQALQFAQKSAVAKRRLVCVNIATNTLTLSFADTFAATTCNQPLLDPGGAANPIPSGLTITPAAFNFLPSGRTSLAANLGLIVSGSNVAVPVSITIEAETGHVR